MSQRRAVDRTTSAPHRQIRPKDAKDRFLLTIFDELWSEYRRRVPAVQTYEQVVAEHGGTFVNDHVAFRTIAVQRPQAGIATLSRVFESLGYAPAGTYVFPDKHLASIHYQHPQPGFPKLFISELRTWEMAPDIRRILLRTLSEYKPTCSDQVLATLAHLKEGEDARRLLRAIATLFQKRPWPAPEKKALLAVNEASQFGAWVMLHGYAVNHFTALVNSHGVSSLGDIEKTVNAMRQAGIPMKSEIEGKAGSKLRQTATEAASSKARIRDRGRSATISWPYAYFEFAERGDIIDADTQKPIRFEGFLGPQATQLFEMTRRKNS